ncbi:B3/B4 domain-containing protein (DNA/RNA-binding domain of Phe-tRNA-synthetase) [Stigmatella aurantiaca]|uniref:B3/B4 domain-containing protein (DNA/RNA-binding domain of Phe-tRNA-synthetase) n=1 Tax=Stigmatella aurantiaca TaxID=41 RepID=A0A1H7XI33_STIAU|nr:phenylalanine--tRNA ligase beta subunit-related protein [Stigmatella aurantiaca]SEM33562.1 B3/B4 domain-containing protein (DNA/RNA-binding domain of Phe-tRNA-synthetase) [Stigmatella aurantiaca]
MLTFEPHPLLDPLAFTTTLPAPLSALPSPDWLTALLKAQAQAPLASDDAVRGAVRDVLRHGGYKPTGRGKPASEYLVRAAGDGTLGTINAAVDACNAVSLHSGLPISVVDLDRARAPFRVGIAPEGAQYVFNASGQTIELSGLLCLFDAEGPCSNAVKDAQRTKTSPDTRRTLTVLWGAKALGDRTERAFTWYRELLERLGATVERLPGA